MTIANKVRFLTEFEIQQSNFVIERVGDRILTTADINTFRGTGVDDYIGRYWKRVMGEAFSVFLSFLMRTTSNNNAVQVSKKELSEESSMSIERTSKALKRLKKLGFIQEVSLKGHNKNVYVVRNHNIPIVPQKELMNFPKEMKLEHDEYLNSRL